jgi:hypothetical protein
LRSARRDPDGTKALDVDPGETAACMSADGADQDVRLQTRVEGYADAASRARARFRGPSDVAGGTASDGRPHGARQRALGGNLAFSLLNIAGKEA